MSQQKVTALDPAILIIFGITGDLSRRYLLPALYHLVKQNLLNSSTEIIGVTRGNMTLHELLQTVEQCVNAADGKCDPTALKKLQKMLSLRRMDVTDPKEYDNLLDHLNSVEDEAGVHLDRLYYLSVPPQSTQQIITLMGEHQLNVSCQHGVAETRLLAEKPFGFDLESARELIKETDKQFTEEQIFRIDHYLAKETVQNILAFRFNNPIFEPLWSHKHIDYIEVLANEKLGIEGRVNFYEQTGAVRDLIQSHLLQVLALVTMEQPHKLASDDIHRNKLKLLEQIAAVPKNKIDENAIRGQYETYRKEVGSPLSTTETFAVIRLFIENERWRDTPMIVKTGKGLHERLSEVNIVFKPTEESPHHNVLSFRIQPDEGIELGLRVKKPGFDNVMEHVEMDFSYHRTFLAEKQPTAYERVLVDAIKGNHTLFATSGEIIESWRVVQPVMDAWAGNDSGMIVYKNGSAGPKIEELYPDLI